MTHLLVFISLIAQPPKSLSEVEINKILAFHELQNYREILEVELIRNGNDHYSMKAVTCIAGKKLHFVLTSPDGNRLESIVDGKISTLIVASSKVYCSYPYPADAKFDPRAHLLKIEPGKFSFNSSSGAPFRFSMDPDLPITSDGLVEVDHAKFRRVVVSGVGTSGRRVSITQYFLPDRWLLQRFEIEGEAETGTFYLNGKVTVSEFSPKFPETEFLFDPKAVDGFKKLSLDEITKMSGG